MSGKKDHIDIQKTTLIRPCTIEVPASKSESNRALIIRSLAGKGVVKNLSTARDTRTMEQLLQSDEKILDVIDAGTTMRFLTAYLALKGENRIITGTPRMRERPIGIMVEALKQLGANIEYMEKEGYPPLQINAFRESGVDQIRMRGDVSSQYISAILMISPMLSKGLKLELTGRIGSKPYIDMTLGIMEHFGVKADKVDNMIFIPPQAYKETEFSVDPDWSGASYWYAFTALAEEAEVLLKNFSLPSYQGDSRILDIMANLGVRSEFTDVGLVLTKKEHIGHIEVDFTDIPDLAQTVIVTCALKGITARLSGLESLRIKETDRIAALQAELSKLGARLIEHDPHHWELYPAPMEAIPEKVYINTYEDHRMAMAFAPLACRMHVSIEDPAVVSKSYPSFWEDMKKAGFGCML